jgi:hypothetical protein
MKPRNALSLSAWVKPPSAPISSDLALPSAGYAARSRLRQRMNLQPAVAAPALLQPRHDVSGAFSGSALRPH